MKKLLFLLAVLVVPFMIVAQPMDTLTTYFEDFDTAPYKVTISTSINPPAPDWTPSTTLYRSSPQSIHSPVDVNGNITSIFTDTIRVRRDLNHTYVYLMFDQICKVNNLDEAYIDYRISTGTTPSGNLTWSSWTQIQFTPTSSFYYGGATNIVGGKFTDQAYTIWNSANMSATPTQAWWKHELFDISQFVVGTSNTHFQIRFRMRKTSPQGSGTENCAGWFIDNVRFLSSLTEIIPCSITLQAPIYVNRTNTSLNNIGPFTVKAKISDNDTVNTNITTFNYEVNSGPLTPVANTITSNTYASGNNNVLFQWTIPSQCYEDVITYHIYSEDTHGFKCRIDTTFIPHHNYTNLGNNDGKLVRFYGWPYALITGQSQTVSLTLQNKSDHNINNNYMTSLQIGWSVNGNIQTPYTWTGSLCLDDSAQVTIGSFIPVRGFNCVEAWIITRNGAVDDRHANDTLSDPALDGYCGYACDSIMGGVYTLGRSYADFPTLADLKDKLFYCGVDGPITINIYPGTYANFNFTQTDVFVGQSAINSITFQSLSGNAADVIIVDSNSTATGAITLNNTAFYNFNNLTIQGKTGSTYSRGVYISNVGSKYITISNCIINIEPTTAITNNFSGICRSAAPSTRSDSTINIINNTINGGAFGIYYYGSTSFKNIINNISGNTINTSYKGIYTYYCNIDSISNNTVVQSSSSNQAYMGLHIERAERVKDISKNKINSPVNIGIGLYLNYVLGQTGNNVLVSNNEIRGKATSDNVYGIELLNSNYIDFIHNSSRLYSITPLGVTSSIFLQSGNTVNLLNNIFINECISSTNLNYPIYIQNLPTNFTSDYNDYYSSGSFIGFYTVPRSTLPEWITALGRDTNSISFSPVLIDPSISLEPLSYNHLECLVSPRVSTDIRNFARNGEITYLGAYSIPVPSPNLTITSLISPPSPELLLCPEDHYPITVRITNVGGSTINFANTNATVRTIASGGLTLNQAYTVNTGILAPLHSADITIIPSLAIPSNVNIDFTFIVSINGDTVNSNDTLRRNYKLEVISPDYEEVFSNNPLTPIWRFEQVAGAGNWTVQAGEGIAPVIAPVYGTGRLFFNSRSFSNTTISRAIMPTIDLSSSINPTLEFWFAHDNGYSSSTYTTLEGVTVKISTDGGLIYNDLIPQGQTTALIKRYNSAYTTPGWAKYTIDLSNYETDSCVFIAFEARSRNGNNINIDRVVLKNVYDNDLSVTDIYCLGAIPTQDSISQEIKARIINEGAQGQLNKQVTLTISGANTYTETIIIPNLPYQGSALVTFHGTQLLNNGINNVHVEVQSDQNNINNAGNRYMGTFNHNVAYSDTSSVNSFTGSSTSIKVVNRYKVAEELIVKAVTFYPVNASDAVGKRVLAFVSNASGAILTTSDTITLTSDMINTWQEIPINNFALTNLSDWIFVGIEMIDPGYYIGTQLEAPIRDSAFYFLNGTTYDPQTRGKFMIGAVVAQPILNELAILSLVSPITNCDLGHENITVNITNNGPRPIIPGTVFHYTIDGAPTVTETLNDTVLSHETRNFIFQTDFDFTNNLVGIDSTYSICVWIDSLPTDYINFNDSLCLDIVSLGKSNTPIVTDTVYVNFHNSTTLTATLPSSIPQGVLTWFSNTGFESWQYLYQGNSYTTPLIFFDTTYYVNAAPGYIYTNTVGTGTLTGTHPLVFNQGYSRGRILYTQSEIGSYGSINKISIDVATVAGGALGIPIKIYIKQTDLATLPNNAPFDWDAELSGAQLIFDSQYYFNTTGWFDIDFSTPFEYTSGNILILTETNCGGTNCGTSVSGSTTYPSFKTTTVPAGYVQYKSGNSDIFTGTYSTNTRRWNMKFNIPVLTCPSEKVPIYIHVPNMPNYDVKTVELVYPYTSCTLGQEYIQVKLKNIINNTIPSGKIMIKATFNGSTITHIVSETFLPEETKTITFTTPFDFTASNAAITFNYVISTDLIGETTVYRGNDTIRSSFISTQTDAVPDVINYTGNFTLPFTVRPDLTHTIFYFYDSDTASTYFYSGLSYTTPPLYDTLTLWVSARSNHTASTCETERIQVNINVFVPDFDLATNQLVSPVSYECGLMNENIITTIGNTMDTVIPGNTFILKAKFTGTTNRYVEDTISQAIAQYDTLDYTFINPVILGSTTLNNIYNYLIYTDPVNPLLGVYHGNDTIRGELKVPATPLAPPAIVQSATYGVPKLITPTTAAPLNYFYFYNQQTGGTLLGEGVNYLTSNIYSNPTTYYYSGRISEPDFATDITLGQGTQTTTLPFNFTNGQSVGVILYTNQELGGYPGTIDTVSIYVSSEALGEIPVKFYLKNDTRTALTGGNYNWSTFTTGAQLIFDGITNFNEPGWFKIPIPGGFDYSGESLLLLTYHDCGSQTCLASGVNPLPSFRYTSTSPSYKVIYKADNAPITTASFTTTYFRLNTKFYINYACESPRSSITLNTSVPARDLEVANIITPVTPNNNYTAAESVSVRIINHGTTSASGFTLGYFLEGNAPVEQTFTTTIASGANATCTFTTPIDLSDIYFPTDFHVYVRYTNDNFNTNDTAVIAVQKPNPCISRAINQTGADISNFTFAGINNGPGTPIFSYNHSPNDSRYTDYSQLVSPAFVVQGQFYPFSVTNSFSATTGTVLYKYVYIDFNRDNVFSADERVFYTPSPISAPTPANPSNATTPGIITIPSNATLGITRLRVICTQTAVSDPCTTYGYGETEDYSVLISPPFENDLGLVTVTHPVGDICSDNAGKIKVVVKNYGSNPQIFSTANSLTVSATVTGIIPGIYSKTITNGAIGSGATMDIIIDNVNYSQIGTYNVTPQIIYALDEYNINDAASSVGIVSSTNITYIPVSENFEAFSLGTIPASSFWNAAFTASNFKWDINEGQTGNYPSAGPLHDHTIGEPIMGFPEGKYAVVEGTSSIGTAPVTTLTSGCINLHYELGYPKRINYWENIFSNSANSRIKLLMQVGSGEYFVTIDSLINRTQTSSTQPWLYRANVLVNIDEIAKVRFLVTGHSGNIDPAIDDIEIDYAKPDIGVESILFPVDIEVAGDTNCLFLGDSINMTIRIKNYGLTPVNSFDMVGIASVGTISQTVTEHWSGPLGPGETREYTFATQFANPQVYNHCQYQAKTVIPDDSNPNNDIKTIISCLVDGINDYDIERGVILGQNIPNPAISETRIPFFIPEGGQVGLKIYSVEGQLLYATSNYQESGDNYFDINTENFASGIYLYTFQFKDVTLIKKMIIQK